MAEMSSLAKILLIMLRGGSWFAGVLLLGFIGIILWQRMTPDGSLDLRRGDITFLAVVVFLVGLAVYLVRAITREIDKPGG